MLDLGTFPGESDLDLVFDFKLSGALLPEGFAENFIFGAASAAPIVLPPGAEVPVPEPGSLSIFGIGLAAMLWARRRHRQVTPVTLN